MIFEVHTSLKIDFRTRVFEINRFSLSDQGHASPGRRSRALRGADRLVVLRGPECGCCCCYCYCFGGVVLMLLLLCSSFQVFAVNFHTTKKQLSRRAGVWVAGGNEECAQCTSEHNWEFTLMHLSNSLAWNKQDAPVNANVHHCTTNPNRHPPPCRFQMFSGDVTHEGSSSSCINACFALLEGVTVDTTNDEWVRLCTYHISAGCVVHFLNGPILG